MSAVERYEGNAGLALLSDRDWGALERQASALANSGLLPAHLNKQTDKVLGCAITLATTGLPVNLNTLACFDDINGKMRPNTQLLIALANMHGVDIWFDEKADSRWCRAYGQQLPNGRVKHYEYTIEQATQAGYTKKDVWKHNPDVMLSYRCASRLIRRSFSHLLLGVPGPVLDMLYNDDADVYEATVVSRRAAAEQVSEAVGDDEDIADGEVVEESPAEPKRTTADRIRDEIEHLSDQPVDEAWVQKFAIAVRGLAEDCACEPDDLRHAIVYAATDGRTQSSKEVQVGEVDAVKAVFVAAREGDAEYRGSLIDHLPFDGPEAA